jgi:hypothetical protein
MHTVSHGTDSVYGEPVQKQVRGRRFVIAGCSRSGTTYMAKLLSAIGCDCGHERIFNICRIEGEWGFSEPMSAFYEPKAKQGDASFLSIPYIDRLPEATVVLHQVRNPLAVIRSHMGMRFFADPYQPSIYLADQHPQILDFLRLHCPEIFEADTEIERCMRYWLHWNRLAERASEVAGLQYLRYRVEDLDYPLLQRILHMIGCDVTADRCDQALESVSRLTNTRHLDNPWTGEKLLKGFEINEIQELANRYGYTL